MQITRRNAMLGASAAAVTGLTVAPIGMKASGVKAALAGVPGVVKASQTDPVAVLVRKASAYEEWLNSLNVPDDEFNALAGVHFEMEHRILDTPATSLVGIVGKLRIAWKNAETDELYPLASERFIWSALQDLERGQRLEIDDTLGHALDEARRLGIPAPTLEMCYSLCEGINHNL